MKIINHIDEFTGHINQVNPAIKFTIERESQGTLPMLDTLIHRRDDGGLYATIFRKSTHTDQYLNFSSSNPLQHKMGVVRTLIHRAETIITNQEDKILEIEHIRGALSDCGYPDWVFHQYNKRSKRKVYNRSDSVKKNKGMVVLPYIQGVSDPLMRLYQKKGVQCQFRPINTIRRNLVAPKDKISMQDRSGTVYHIPCSDCSASYIGESERPLRARLKEHKRPSNMSSPVVEHVTKQKHEMDWEAVEVLDQESEWFARGVREAIHIRRQGSTLNRDGGRHQLRPVYDVLLSRDSPSSRDKIPRP